MSIEICSELHQNFLEYSYEYNSQRAFPSIFDGLKPGQRACLWEMFVKGYSSSKPHVKSAKVSGGVIASLWPHSNAAIYETFARMSQPWINNICEVDWHGANGSPIGGPECASERYTECRLSKAAEDGFFSNIKKKTVPMILNFSEDEEWPEIFPAIFPRLFVNGSQGIGSTLANVWLCGNLGELIEKIKQFLSTGVVTYDNIYPDFPSGGIIINKNEIPEIYKTGKGRCVLRAKTSIEGNSILIHELPYQEYAEPLIEDIKKLVMSEEITGIAEIYNKSDKKRILIEIECEKSPAHILNQLFQKTNLQKTYNANQYALVTKVPQLVTLLDYIKLFSEHNITCIKKEYEFDLNKAKNRMEIVEGLIKAIAHIDDIIKLIKGSESSSEAIKNLIKVYEFTENQSKAIVDMKLGKLAKLEGVELEKEKQKLQETIDNCNFILSNRSEQESIFLSRLEDFNKKYGYNRHTEVVQISTSKEDQEIANIEPEKCVVVMTESGLIKRIPSSSFRVQKRNGKGVKTQDDITNAAIKTNTIDFLMIFTNKGKMYRLLVDEIPTGTNSSRGVPIKSLIELDANEEPKVIYSIYRDSKAKYVLFVTKNGIVKKTSLEEYSKTKKGGVIAINLKEDDALASVILIDNEDLAIFTKQGMGIKFKSSEISITGRATQGVKGITLKEGDCVSSVVAINNNETIALFSPTGTSKRLEEKELPTQKRAGKGLICYKTGIVSAQSVSEDNSILVIGETKSICISVKDIPLGGRALTGNQVIQGNHIVSTSKVG